MATCSSTEKLHTTVYWCPPRYHGGDRQCTAKCFAKTQTTANQVGGCLLRCKVVFTRVLLKKIPKIIKYIMLKTNKSEKYSKPLTQIKVCCRPVTVQFGLQSFILAVHFNSFRVEVNSVTEISFFVFFIAFVLVNLCYC